MRRSTGIFFGILGLATLAGGATATGQERGSPTRVFYDNGNVRVQEVTFKPGDQGPNIPRPFRVIRVLQGGTMQRVHADGTIESVEYKTGEVKVYEADKPFVPKNMGTSPIVLYVVAIRQTAK